MSFTTPVFLIFLPVVLLLYWLLPAKMRWMMLLAASLLFYAWHNVWLLSLILTTILVSYLCARFIEEAETPAGKRKAMTFCAFVCLGILVIFKYLDFLTGSAVSLANFFGADISFSGFGILLPMGISFYVFQTMSYVLDVYRGTVKAEHHLGHYALFVAFFPQLVAGPIERPGDLLPQLKQPRPFRKDYLPEGIPLLLRGYGKKLLIADFLAIWVDNAYADVEKSGGLSLLIATVFFAFQIYCDFSGYCDIAQGCARLMGIRLKDNFRIPYAATSIRDFWHRWHISLTQWFTDYLYIPLGGSRKGQLRTCVNILLTFFVSGLWHGARWNYVLWGCIHGLYLCFERFVLKKKSPGPILTFLLVCFAWIFFRSASIADAFTVLTRMVTAPLATGLGIPLGELFLSIALIAFLPFLEKLPHLSSRQSPQRQTMVGFLYCFLLFAILLCRFWVLSQYGETAFLYFQF